LLVKDENMAKKNKLTSSGSINIKNPLAQILGIVLRKNRLKLYRDNPDFVANSINVQSSYYRAVEAGTYNLHISHALKLSEAFYTFSYEAVLKILSTITIIDVNIKEEAQAVNIEYNKSFFLVFKSISSVDNKIKFLYEKYSKNKLLQNLLYENPDESSKYIIENGLDHILEEFLMRYDKLDTNQTIIQKNKIANSLQSIPTLYFDHIENYLKITDELPIRVRFSDLWKWEEVNTPIFTKLYGIFQSHIPITCYENLRRYTYPYLWSPKFTELSMVFIDEGISSEEILDLFIINLTRSLVENNKRNLLRMLPDMQKKITFKVVRKNELTNQILTGKDLDNIKFDDNADFIYDAFWVFDRGLEKHPVSFLAIQQTHKYILDYEYFVEGSSLNLEETTLKQEIMSKLIKE